MCYVNHSISVEERSNHFKNMSKQRQKVCVRCHSTSGKKHTAQSMQGNHICLSVTHWAYIQQHFCFRCPMSNFKFVTSFGFLIQNYTAHVFLDFYKTSKWAWLAIFCVLVKGVFQGVLEHSTGPLSSQLIFKWVKLPCAYYMRKLAIDYIWILNT